MACVFSTNTLRISRKVAGYSSAEEISAKQHLGIKVYMKITMTMRLEYLNSPCKKI
jgi:hypothetical protein